MTVYEMMFKIRYRIRRLPKRNWWALPPVVQLLGHCPAKFKVSGVILGQDTCLGSGFGPWLGHVQEAPDQ